MKLTPFQAIVIGAFVVAILGGVASLALFRGGSQNLPNLTMWGTIPASIMTEFLGQKSFEDAGIKISYVQKNPSTFEEDFVEALASGLAPDLVIMPHDLIYKQRNKLLVIPFDSISERVFKDTFVESGEIFLTEGGMLGLPFTLDPLVMYWNRSMFSSKAISTPPKFWDEFFTLAPKFNERNAAGNLNKTVVSLGESVNITNFKEILSVLIMQAGNPIVSFDQGRVRYNSLLNERFNLSERPAEASIRFYTEFSNPVKPTFSWNKSLLDSRDAFVSEELGTYFGFSSELPTLRKLNPNLNFDVTTLPQVRDGEIKMTYAKVNALVIPRSARNASAGAIAAQALVSANSIESLSLLTGLPPVRRDLLSTLPTEASQNVFYRSAVMSRTWLDPSSEETDTVFSNLVENVNSGRLRVSQAVDRADSELQSVISNYER